MGRARTRGQQSGGHPAVDAGLLHRLVLQEFVRDADGVDAELARAGRAEAEQVARLRQSERERPRCLHGRIADLARIGLDAARDVDGEHRAVRLIDELHCLADDGAQRAAEARAEDAVEHAVREAQSEAQPVHVAVPRQVMHSDAHRRQGLLHDGRRSLEVVGIARQEYLEVCPLVGEIARRRERIAAVVAAAREDADRLAAHRAEQRDHLCSRLPPGILHQHDLRQAVLLSCAPVDSAHLLDK